MVPEDLATLHKQWRRWATGNGQVMGTYGLGGGNVRIATVNAISWIDMLVPIPVTIRYGLMASTIWALGAGVLIGLVGAIRLKRAPVALVGIFMPFMSILWTLHAFQGLYLAYRLSRSGETQQLTWVSPKRSSALDSPSS